MHDDDCFYISMPVPDGLTIEHISELKERISLISPSAARLIFEASTLGLDKVSLEDAKLSEDDLFELSKDGEEELKMKIAVRSLLNEAINHILLPILSDPVGLMWSPKRNDFGILNISGSRYVITGGPKKYTWSSPTKAYDHIVALNIFGIYAQESD
jgi:hypothetical protein